MDILLKRNILIDYLLIIIGVSLMATSIRVIYEPLGLVTGGVSGFAIVVEYWTKGIIEGGIPLWLTNAVINVPLFIIGIFVKGRGYILRSFIATVLFTIELSLIPEFHVADEDYVIAAIIGGVLTGVGHGLVIITLSSTGGTDLLSAIIRYFFPHKSITTLILYIDSMVVILGAAAFGIKNALYAIVAVYITSKVMDGVVSGLHYAKMMLIVTDKGELIAKDIIEYVDRGVTSVKAKGMYSGNERDMLICAMSKRESIAVMRIVNNIDKTAFVMIADTKEILGEGFGEVGEFLH